MGDIRVNLRSFVTIGLTAFIMVWLVNRALSYAGLGQFQA